MVFARSRQPAGALPMYVPLCRPVCVCLGDVTVPGLSLFFHENPVVVEGAPCCSFRLHVRAPGHHSFFETTIGCSHVMVAPASQSVGGRLFPLARSIDVPPCRYYLSGQAAEAGDAGRVVCCVPWRSRALPMV